MGASMNGLDFGFGMMYSALVARRKMEKAKQTMSPVSPLDHLPMCMRFVGENTTSKLWEQQGT